MMYKVLVTGGSGFIGSHLVERLKRLGHKVSFVDLVGRDYKLDIRRPALVNLMMKLRPHAVYHLAAANRVTGALRETLENNVIGTYNVLEACRLAGVNQFIFTSSAAVYGNPERFPIQESWPTKPISAYGVSKLTDELYCQIFARFFPSTIFRFANVYGPRQKNNNEGGVVAIFIKNILAGNPVTIYGTGGQTRDFVFVADVVDALAAALGKKQPGLFNIGSGHACSVINLVKLLEQLTGKPVKINYRPLRAGEIDASLFSFNRAKKQLDWRPKTGLKEGLNATINFNLTSSK